MGAFDKTRPPVRKAPQLGSKINSYSKLPTNGWLLLVININCSLTRNITSHSMKNLAFQSFLGWKMIVQYVYQLSLPQATFSILCGYIFWWDCWGNLELITLHVTLSLPRVINVKFLLQPHQKYYTIQNEERLAFHFLLRWNIIIYYQLSLPQAMKSHLLHTVWWDYYLKLITLGSERVNGWRTSCMLPFHSQEWSMSNFSCSLTWNITSYGMKNLAFHSLLSWQMINYQFSLHHLYISLL